MRPNPVIFLASILTLGAPTAADAAGHNEVRFEAQTMFMSHTKSAEKYTTTSTGSSSTERTSEDSSKEDRFTGTSAYPSIGFTTFNEGLVVGTEFFSFAGPSHFFAGSVAVGKEFSSSIEVGGLLYADYSSSKKETNVDADDATTASPDTKRSEAERDFAFGPYARFSLPSSRGTLEIEPSLVYLRENNDSNIDGTFTRLETKAGWGLQIDLSYVIPLWKEVSYVGTAGVSYKTYSSGKKVESRPTSGGETSAKLKSSTATSVSVSLLGLRASL